MNLNESQLVDRILKGDSESFRELHDSHKKSLIRACWYFLGNDSEVEDMVQETYIKALKNLHRFRFEPLAIWLNHISADLCHDYLTKKRKSFPLLSNDKMADGGVPDEMTVEQISFRLDQKVESIWIKHQPPVILRFYRLAIGVSCLLGFLGLFICLVQLIWPKILVVLPQVDLAAQVLK